MAFARNIPKLAAFRLLFWMHFLAAVLTPFYTDWAGLALGQVLVLNAWFMAWNFVLEVPTGAVADFFGRRWSLVLGALVAAAMALLYVSTRRFGVFLVAEMGLAMAYTLVSGADDALAYDTLVRLDRAGTARAVAARLESWKLAGILAGALGGSAIAARFGLAAPLAFQAVPALLAAAVAWTLREPTAATRYGRDARYLPVLLSGVRYLRGHRTLRLLALDMVGIGAIAWTLIWLYQPLLRAAGLPVVWLGSVHALLCLGQIAVLRNVERLERLVGSPRRWFVVTALATGAGFVALGMVTWLPAVLVLVVATQAMGLARLPVYTGYMNAHIGSEHRATVLSAVSMLRTLAVVIANLAAGWLADRSLHGAMAVLGVAALAATAASRVEDVHLEG